MTAALLLEQLAAKKIVIQLAGDGLRFKFPIGTRTPEVLQAIRENREQLAEILSMDPPRSCLQSYPRQGQVEEKKIIDLVTIFRELASWRRAPVYQSDRYVHWQNS